MIWRKDLSNGFYEWEVAYFSKNLHDSEKNQPGLVKPAWFVKKNDSSTMFPDDWTEDDVKNSIAEAYSKKKKMKNNDGDIVDIWLDSHWNQIVFWHEWNSVKSAYPSFENFYEIIN